MAVSNVQITVKARRRRYLLALAVAALLWAGATLVAAALGAVRIPLLQVLAIVGSKAGLPVSQSDATLETVIWHIRLPRVVLGSLVGGALALAGAAFQGLLRNPLADPYILGVSGGASLGAVLALVFGLGGAAINVPFCAFLGALASIGLVFLLGRRRGTLPVPTLLLAGVAISSFLGSIVSLIVLFSGERMGSVLFWLMGGLDGASWQAVGTMLPYMLLAGAVMVWHARALNALACGEETAANLGIDVERLKLSLFVAASLLTAAAVSVSGVIGFVGLIVPHVVRMLVGPDQRGLLPISFFLGAAFLVIADTIARTAIAPQELPVGAVTALCGAPFFIHLLRRQGLVPGA